MKRQVFNYNRERKSQEFDSLGSSQVTTIELKNIELHPVYDDKSDGNQKKIPGLVPLQVRRLIGKDKLIRAEKQKEQRESIEESKGQNRLP